MSEKAKGISKEENEELILKEIERDIKKRSEEMKQEIKNLFENVHSELEKDGNINLNESIYEQDKETYKKVLKYIIETGKVKISEITEKFNIGYVKAVTLIEDFKQNNYIKINISTGKYDTITVEQLNSIL